VQGVTNVSLKMGRGMRVCWRPDGAVMIHNLGTIDALALVRMIPVAGKGKVVVTLFN
jgi:hypothetical protein